MPFWPATKDQQRITELERKVELLEDLVGRLNEAIGGALGRLNELEAQRTERPRSHFSKGNSAAGKRTNEKAHQAG